ncbi:MAG: DNA-binding response regulator [Saprospiraceae bacterium]|nr:MAG: DNA-binding response regulator [Saprospiraceae bacterium]
MNNIRCLIVEDEELARTLLENYISRLPNLELVAQCKNPLEAIKVMGTQQIDLLFLDIQMPELTGIEFLKTLSQKPLVIFTTAYSQYALEGYSLDVVDYLLKPFGFERFVQAVNKAGELFRLRQQGASPQIIAQQESPEKDHILVKSDHKIHRLPYSEILYIQSMREYVAYHTPGKRILSLGSLKALETSLPPELFIRIHKSYIVAKSKVATLEGNMVHIGNEKIPIGASYREEVVRELF